MSRRFGRQQKRQMREQLAKAQSDMGRLEQRLEMRHYESNPRVLNFVEIRNERSWRGMDYEPVIKPENVHSLHRMDVDVRSNDFDPDRHLVAVCIADHQACSYINTKLIRDSNFRALEPLCQGLAHRLIGLIQQLIKTEQGR